jgi:Flp pilus assembly pilin Flp
VIAALPPSGMNEWIDIALTCGFGLSIALLSCGTMASMSGIGDHVAARFDAFFARRAAALPVFAFVAFSALREALESFLLLRFVAASHGAEAVAWGIALGLVACALLAAAWRTLEANRRTHIVFRLSAVLLFVLGVQMVLEALAEVLMRGVAGGAFTPLGRALSPYLEHGDRQWMLFLVLAAIPLAVWTRAWWRRAGA